MITSNKTKPANLGDLFFDLCVNFLLYCALIIVFYMLVRFYLEEDTDIDTKGGGYEALNTEEHDDYEDEDDKEDEIKIQKEMKKVKELLEIEEPTLVEEPNETKIDPESNNNIHHPITIKHSKHTDKTEPTSGEETRKDTLQRVLYYGLGLNIIFSILGLVQERIITQPYDGDYFEYSYGLVFVNRLGGLILSFILMYIYSVQWVYSPLWEYSFPSVANMLSSWCQYEALKYVRLV